MQSSKQGYSIILSVLMVGFMLVLTHGILTLVIWESKDSRAMESYLKAYAWAEWALEMWMLEAKKNIYGIDITQTGIKNVLHSSQPAKKNVDISYTIQGATREISSLKLASWQFAIIPLFSKGSKVTSPRFVWGNSEVVWNIVSKTSGISGVGNFTKETLWKEKTISSGEVSLQDTSIQNFLTHNEESYLILQNIGTTEISYALSSDKIDEYFTNTTTKIVGTGEVWGFKQNVFIEIDIGKYLNLLKYSVFSPN